MKVAIIQHDIAWEDAATTCARLEPTIDRAAATDARLIVLPEMFSTGFSMAPERVAEPVDGPSATFLTAQAIRHDAYVCASIPTVAAEHPLPVNRLLVCGPDGPIDHYDKIHPFSFAGEDAHYAPGNRFLTLDLDGVRCTFFICYDLRFADEFWATAAATDCYVIPANWPRVRRHHWQTLLQARAIENQAYVVAANRVGPDGNGLDHAGDSMIIDPLGATLASAAETETTLLSTVDAAVVADVRARFPFQNDRR